MHNPGQKRRTGALGRLLESVRQRPLVFALAVVLGPAVAIGLSLAEGRERTATATFLLAPGEGAPRDATGPDERDVATTTELLALPAVAAAAAADLGGTSAEDVAEDIEIQSEGDADVVKVVSSAGSSQDAVRLANAYARAYEEFRRGLPAQAPRPAEPSLVQAATSSTEVAARALWIDGLLGLLAGLVLGLVLASLVRGITRTVRSIEEIEEIYGLPALARVPRSDSLAKGTLGKEAVTQAIGFSEEAEAFRTLRANLRYFNVDSPIRSILVASPLPGDGKSTVARHLAITMASMGDSVCLVNADLRKREPGTSRGSEGLSLVLAGFDLDTALTEVPISFDPVTEESRVLVELANGPLPPNPAELLESARMRWVLTELERRFAFVIVDSPALVTVSDALSLLPATSGVLIVSGVERTIRQAALDLRRQVDLLGARPLGVVANFAPSGRGSEYYDDARDGTTSRRRRGSRPRTTA